MNQAPDAKHGGDYADRGEYHRTLDKRWPYYPVYVEKMRRVRAHLDALPPTTRIVDLGCGEGLLVEEYSAKGYAIEGIDFNYTSAVVKHGDITALDYEDGSFDRVLSLDVLEHLQFEQQEKAFAEIRRILHPDGRALISLPNLAHFASRVSFLALGKLLRTADIERHPGDRPMREYLDLVKRHGMRVVRNKGLFPTYPVIAALTMVRPDLALPLHRVANALPQPPGWCFLNLLELAPA